MSEVVLGYIPCSSSKKAEALAEQLLHKKLIACANIINEMQSVYFWQGQLENSGESILLIKTTQKKWIEAELAIKNLHDYDCPCILSLSLNSVNQEYKDWISSQLEEQAQ